MGTGSKKQPACTGVLYDLTLLIRYIDDRIAVFAAFLNNVTDRVTWLIFKRVLCLAHGSNPGHNKEDSVIRTWPERAQDNRCPVFLWLTGRISRYGGHALLSAPFPQHCGP